jgi:hypothetical protein
MSNARHAALKRFAMAEYGTIRGQAAGFLADYVVGSPGLATRHDQMLAKHGEKWLTVLDEVAAAHNLRTATMAFAD